MTESPLWTWVDKAEGLEEVARAMSASRRVAVDTESDSMHSYFEKVCLLQFATRKEAFVVDPLAGHEGRRVRFENRRCGCISISLTAYQ